MHNTKEYLKITKLFARKFQCNTTIASGGCKKEHFCSSRHKQTNRQFYGWKDVFAFHMHYLYTYSLVVDALEFRQKMCIT